jgi:hypothetical protein
VGRMEGCLDRGIAVSGEAGVAVKCCKLRRVKSNAGEGESLAASSSLVLLPFGIHSALKLAYTQLRFIFKDGVHPFLSVSDPRTPCNWPRAYLPVSRANPARHLPLCPFDLESSAFRNRKEGSGRLPQPPLPLKTPPLTHTFSHIMSRC